MPIYEYHCNCCQEKFSRLFLGSFDPSDVQCASCTSRDVTKLVSTFAVHQSEASRLAAVDQARPQGDDFYQDRRNIGLWAKKQLQQRGIEPGAQFEAAVEKARTGKFLE